MEVAAANGKSWHVVLLPLEQSRVTARLGKSIAAGVNRALRSLSIGSRAAPIFVHFTSRECPFLLECVASTYRAVHETAFEPKCGRATREPAAEHVAALERNRFVSPRSSFCSTARSAFHLLDPQAISIGRREDCFGSATETRHSVSVIDGTRRTGRSSRFGACCALSAARAA